MDTTLVGTGQCTLKKKAGFLHASDFVTLSY